MRLRRAALLWLWLLAACAGQQSGPTSTQPPAAPTVPADGPMIGPVLGFYIESAYEDTYLALFDTTSGAFRELPATLDVVPGAGRWFDDGCTVYINGRLLDLRGNVIWSPDAAAGIDGAYGSHLSPDRAWLAHVVESGVATGDGPAARDVEVVRLSAPFERFLLTGSGGGHPEALLWADAMWLLYTDYDADGILQVYRAAPDGGRREQLTAHAGPLAQINALALSPDGRRLAYGVRNVIVPRQPYEYREADEGWVGLIDLESGDARQVRLPKLAAVELGRGLVWDAAGERLLVIGDSLPVPHDDPLYGRQAHWLSAGGTVERSFYQADAPAGQVGWISPLGDIDTLMFSSNADYYRYADGETRRLEGAAIPPLGLELGRRPIGILPAVVGFGGEGACGP